MSSSDVALLITALGGSIAAIITAIAALRNSNYSAAKIADLQEANKKLEAQNDRLLKENEDERSHSNYQDEIILDQHQKIERWQQWGGRIGRQMNQLQLQIGAQQQSKSSMDDTQPLPAIKKSWITGPLGPIDLRDVDDGK